LIFSLVALVVLIILCLVTLRAGTQSLFDATRKQRSVIAANLAEAGADIAEAYLRSLSSPPSLTGDEVLLYPANGDAIVLAGGECWAEISAHPDNATSWRKRYVIRAWGEADLTPDGVYDATERTVLRQVIMQVGQQSFALYSYFTDSETSAVAGETIWFYGRDRIYGPAHSNDQFHITWDTSATNPIFYGTISSAQSSAQWSPRTPASGQDWRRIADGGASAFTFNVPEIALPSSTDAQKAAAWGASYGFPTSNGVYLPTVGSTVSAGIYVRGDCTVTFSLESGTNNQVVAITRGSTTTTITTDLVNQRTKYKVGSGTTTTYMGLPNGVIYCTGHITAMSGTLADNYYSGSAIIRRNAWTVATDVLTEKNITITNNLSYRTPPDSTRPPTHSSNLRAATFGAVAESIILSGTPSDMTLNGVFLAGAHNSANGSLYYAGWNTTKRSDLHVLGGIIQKKRGPVGTFRDNTLQTGYNKDYRYDPRMMNDPPPYFPTTGQYDVVSWQYK